MIKKERPVGKILPFSYFRYNISDYTKEMIINPKETNYKIEMKKSISYKDYDYILNFKVNGHDYVIVLFYFIDNGIISYNILFTTLEQYKEYDSLLNGMVKSGKNIISEEDYISLSNILERLTGYNETTPLIKSISYILLDFYPKVSPLLLSIGETRDPVKIEFYRKTIKDSFQDVIETKKTDEFGKDIYYYKIKTNILHGI